MADEDADTPEGVQARATDYLSAAVEERAKARAAIVAGQSPAAVAAGFRAPLPTRRGPTEAMETEDEEPGLKLRPTKGPVQPIPMADLLPPVRISAEQEEILSHLSPSAPDPSPAPPVAPSRSPTPEPEPEQAPVATRRTRAIEMPEPVEVAPPPRRELRAPEWDRYYNPGIYSAARIPRLPIDRATPPRDAPAWELVGAMKSRDSVPDARAPYRASLREGGEVKNSKPERDVERFIAQRAPAPGTEADLEGPSRVPDEPHDEDAREAARKSEFEAALADLERSFRQGAPHPPTAPAVIPLPPPAAPPRPTEPVVQERAEKWAPPAATENAFRPVIRAIARSRADNISEEDENEFAAQDEEEPPLGRPPPPDRLAELAAHRPLAHDVTGASLCPTCGRRIGPHNAVMVCTACGRVACASCGKFSAGQPTGQIYLYEYKFHFPLCQPCFERHLSVQTNLARAKAYLSSGNMTYAYYHAQTALQTDADSPYVPEAKELLKQVEARRTQMQRADKEWEEARKKITRGRTTVLK